jgi:aspartate/methionine/tyrosine aminotransferase
MTSESGEFSRPGRCKERKPSAAPPGIPGPPFKLDNSTVFLLYTGMNPLATELNEALSSTVVAPLLSGLGKRIFFPKGIVAQSAEAKKLATKMNATIGIALTGGKTLSLPSIRNLIPALEPDEIFPYAPTQGVEKFREAWKKEIERKNPQIRGASFSMPVVVPGLTAGISILADLFADPGDTVVLPDLYWDNYPLVFEVRREARIATFPFFNAEGTGMNVKALAETLKRESGKGKLILILNFPNNPTGYSPTKGEAAEIVSTLKAQAEAGTRILAITDDAYFGLFYEPETYTQSLFAPLASLHPSILAAKIDGSTKEHLTWGFRTGFVTFASKDLTAAHYDALTKKLMGAVRSSSSNSSILAQSLILRALNSPTIDKEREDAFRLLSERYALSKKVLAGKKSTVLRPLPFNSGYFMSFALLRGKAEDLRKALLSQEAVGTVAIDEKCLRVAYSSVDADRIAELFDCIYRTAEKVL